MYQRKYCGGGRCVSGERMIRSYENGSVIDGGEREARFLVAEGIMADTKPCRHHAKLRLGSKKQKDKMKNKTYSS